MRRKFYRLIEAITDQERQKMAALSADFAVVCPFCAMHYPQGVTQAVGLDCPQCEGSRDKARQLGDMVKTELMRGDLTQAQAELIAGAVQGGLEYEAHRRLRFIQNRPTESTERTKTHEAQPEP